MARDEAALASMSTNPPTPPSGAPLRLSALMLRGTLTVAVLAPHPDDFDAIGVTLRHLHDLGHHVHVAVLTAGASGVEDGFQGAVGDADKAALREVEQRASARFFGLAPSRLSFLRLWSRGGGDADGDDEAGQGDDEAGLARLRDWLLPLNAQLVFMPHGNDRNRTHQRVYQCFRTLALERQLNLWACLNQDAKTVAMRSDLYMDFDAETAAWKSELLRFHRSQHERNLRTRSIGFDERVLRVNRDAAALLNAPLPYAEVFELERFGEGVVAW
jgi:LmbE family N-acetylglucosaminyl deacetylase